MPCDCFHDTIAYMAYFFLAANAFLAIAMEGLGMEGGEAGYEGMRRDKRGCGAMQCDEMREVENGFMILLLLIWMYLRMLCEKMMME